VALTSATATQALIAATATPALIAATATPVLIAGVHCSHALCPLIAATAAQRAAMHACRYEVVVLDEAHERALNTDILFALLKRLVAARAAASAAQGSQGRGAPQRSSDARGSGAPRDSGSGARDSGAGARDIGSARNSGEAAAELAVDPRLPPLRVVVMSATMDTSAIAAFFGADTSAVINVSGRQFPVTEVWSQVRRSPSWRCGQRCCACTARCSCALASATQRPRSANSYSWMCVCMLACAMPYARLHSVQESHDKDYVSVAAEVAVDLHVSKGPGDILVFLAGQAEVEKAVALINSHVRSKHTHAWAGSSCMYVLRWRRRLIRADSTCSAHLSSAASCMHAPLVPPKHSAPCMPWCDCSRQHHVRRHACACAPRECAWRRSMHVPHALAAAAASWQA
jgi:hypothetical protein